MSAFFVFVAFGPFDGDRAWAVDQMLREHRMQNVNRAVEHDETHLGERVNVANMESDQDLREAHAVLVLSSRDPGEALCEAARALAQNKPVVWVGRTVRTAFRQGVTRVETIEEGIRALTGIRERMERQRDALEQDRPALRGVA